MNYGMTALPVRARDPPFQQGHMNRANEPGYQLPKDGYCFSNSDLKYLQSLSLFEKVQKTQAKLLEWCLRWDWRVYLSFSGGKDSTVLLDLLRRITKTYRKEVPAVFCDTGLEYPEIRTFVKSFTDVEIIKPSKTFIDVIKDHGFPVISKDVSQMIDGVRKERPAAIRKFNGLDSQGRPNAYVETRFGSYRHLIDAPFPISDECCGILKKKPFLRYEKETGRKCITAIMAYESIRRRNSYLKNGCNAFDSVRPISHPMGFWTEQDVLKYLLEFQIPYAPIYGEIVETKNGKLKMSCLDRTGCVFCMFGIRQDKTPNRFQRLKETHPSLYRYCIHKIGCNRVLDYLDIDY